jgi:hypothetical protein
MRRNILRLIVDVFNDIFAREGIHINRKKITNNPKISVGDSQSMNDKQCETSNEVSKGVFQNVA